MLATNSGIAEISCVVQNLSTTYVVIEKHLVNTKHNLPFFYKNNYLANSRDKRRVV